MPAVTMLWEAQASAHWPWKSAVLFCSFEECFSALCSTFLCGAQCSQMTHKNSRNDHDLTLF